jgi:hypothetical protein
MVSTRISEIFLEYQRNLTSSTGPSLPLPLQDLVIVGYGHEEPGRTSVHLGHDEQLQAMSGFNRFAMDSISSSVMGTKRLAPCRIIDVLYCFSSFKILHNGDE